MKQNKLNRISDIFSRIFYCVGIRHRWKFRYCKLLIQEFALRIEQGLIVAILDFFKEEKVRFDRFACRHEIRIDICRIRSCLQSI